MKKGLIGERLTHSYSKVIHEYINNDVYNLYSLNKDEFKLFIENKDFNFVNVTIPYKQDVIHYLDEIKLEAKDIGAVNLVINENGKLIGYNTDYYGFKSMLEYNNVSVYNKNCLILGTGGTSKTVFKVLSDLGAKSIYKASRKKDEENKNIISYSDVYNYDFDIIINTTPVGMYPNLNNTVVDCSKFKKIEFIGDVVYNPLRTRLLIDAEKLNIKHDNGLLMLICQAIKAHEIYYKEEVSKEKIIEIKKHIEKEKKNIVLIGMPGSGKSTVGKILGDTCLKEYIDMDQYIEEKTNMSIPKIFAEYGEEYFRDLETNKIKELMK